MIASCEQPAKIREQTANEKEEKPIMYEKGVDQCMALTHPVWLDLCNCRWPPARLSRRFRKVEVRQHDVPRLVQQDIFKKDRISITSPFQQKCRTTAYFLVSSLDR